MPLEPNEILANLTPQQAEAITALAKFFTGTCVTHHSVGLQLPGMRAEVAKQFFEARKALGLDGVLTEDDVRGRLVTLLVFG